MTRSPAPSRFALLSIVVIAAASCGRVAEIGLPREAPEGLAFAGLYDGTRLVELGAVVGVGDVYAGLYRLTSDESGLTARLFVVKPSDLVEKARLACAAKDRVTRRRLCARAVEACLRDPTGCLTAVKKEESCGERLELDASLPVAVYTPDGTERLALDARADAATLLAGVKLCGPAADPSCPDRLPGFVVTEGGEFRCLAATEQLACAIDVDLSACGAGTVSATVDGQGALSGTASLGGCTLEPLAPGESAVEGGTGFAVVCAGRRFVATYVDSFPGERECPRRGPPVFDNTRDSTGLITGFRAVKWPDQPERWAIAGTGQDDCGGSGCLLAGSCVPRKSCTECCNESCAMYFLADCYRNPWAPCAGDAAATCKARCKSYCDLGLARPGDCRGQTVGRVLTLSLPGTPETDLVRLEMDRDGGGGDRVAAGLRAVADAGTPDRPVIVAVDRAKVQVYLRAPGSALPSLSLELTDSQVGFEVSGVEASPSTPGVFYVYGASTSTAPVGRLLRVALDLTRTPPSSQLTAQRLRSLSRVDRVVVLPSRGEIFCASLADEAAAPAARQTRIERVDAATLAVRSGAIMVPGRIEALEALDDGALLAAIDERGASPDVVAVIDATTGVLREMASALPGLRVASLLVEGPGRAYVGYEVRSGLGREAHGLVGVLERAEGAAKLLPPFVETASAEVSILAFDHARTKVVAVAAHENVLTPIGLVAP